MISRVTLKRIDPNTGVVFVVAFIVILVAILGFFMLEYVSVG